MGAYIVWRIRAAPSPQSPVLLSKKKKKPVHEPFQLSDEQYGAGDAQGHEWQWVDDGFDEGQPSGDPWQDAYDHFEPWPRFMKEKKKCQNRVLPSVVKFRWNVGS